MSDTVFFCSCHDEMIHDPAAPLIEQTRFRHVVDEGCPVHGPAGVGVEFDEVTSLADKRRRFVRSGPFRPAAFLKIVELHRPEVTQSDLTIEGVPVSEMTRDELIAMLDFLCATFERTLSPSSSPSQLPQVTSDSITGFITGLGRNYP